MARITYRGFNLPDGAEVPDVPADLQRLVDSLWSNMGRSSNMLGFQSLTANSGTFGTTDLVIPGLSITVNHVAGRRYAIEFYAATVGAPSASGFVVVSIAIGTTIVQQTRA